MQHKNCGGYLVEGPDGYEGLVCQGCNKDIHLDSEIEESERD